jgi:hypothetical protein
VATAALDTISKQLGDGTSAQQGSQPDMSKCVQATQHSAHPIVPTPLACVAQAGIDLKSLDTSYFTSMSYYILLLLGSKGAMSLIFREHVVDDMENMKRTQMMGMGAPNPSFDAEAQFKLERTALATVSGHVCVTCRQGTQLNLLFLQMEHEWFLETAESRALQVLQKGALASARPKSKKV